MSMSKFSGDPFLCSDCRTLGYCKRRIESSSVLANKINDKDISWWVPLSTRKVYNASQFSAKLQRAHDLFHQGEYEGASYMYRDLLSTGFDSKEINIGLVASLYFLKQYQDAAALASTMETGFDKMPTAVVNRCLVRMSEEAKLKEIEQNDTSKELVIDKKKYSLYDLCI